MSCDGVPLAAIAGRLGTPLYVYSAEGIREAYRRFDRAFRDVPHAVHYALKANSSLAVLRLLRGLGSGADANSGGEIEVALRAGFIPADIVFTGVGKTGDELERAVALGVKAINAESPGEIDRIDAVARSLGVRARVAVRVNPDIDPHSHPHISTGLRENKFGVPIELARPLFRDLAGRAGLDPVGVHVHIGSQVMSLDPLCRTARELARLVSEIRDDGIRLEHVDLGGGLGIAYNEDPAPTADAYAAAVLPAIRGLGLKLLLEPGRVIVGPAGVLVSRVVDIKVYPGGRRFVVLDSGMTELLRPALYGAYHRIEPAVRRPGAATLCDFVGPLCESSDVVGRDRLVSPVEVGDLIVICDVGAYGATMASTYNRRTLAPEALVDDGGYREIRRRQTVADLVALEE
ncbi:MAG: diaminopimelate decarboxylase [Planctomycetes bacterium]|nr:diaminopimelate decarboxylase [Planctomycetota bacterium]